MPCSAPSAPSSSATTDPSAARAGTRAATGREPGQRRRLGPAPAMKQRDLDMVARGEMVEMVAVEDTGETVGMEEMVAVVV